MSSNPVLPAGFEWFATQVSAWGSDASSVSHGVAISTCVEGVALISLGKW